MPLLLHLIRRFQGVLGKSSREFEDMGEFIRESIEQWAKHRKKTASTGQGKQPGSGEAKEGKV